MDSFDEEMNLRLKALEYADAHILLMRDKTNIDERQLERTYRAAQALFKAARKFAKVSPE